MSAEPRGAGGARAAALPWPVHLRYWVVVVLWMGVISYLSTDAFSASNTHRYLDPFLRWLFPDLTNPEVLRMHSVVRKLAHFGEFFVLSGLAYWAQRAGRATAWRGRWALQALLLVVVYASIDELHQAFTNNRTASLADSGVDGLGGAAAQALIFLRYRLGSRG